MNKKGRAILITSILVVALLAVIFVNAAPKQCNDGLDNDGDGLTDYPNDPGCTGNSDNNENNCGDAIVNGNEVCDGSNLNGQTCVSQGFSGGTLSCASSCTSFVTSSCFTNSCSDTDGGVVYGTQGTISGSQSGSSYSFTDSCGTGANATLLTERFCSGTTPALTTFNCNSGNFTSCSNGACQ